jgi:hypothetical protein
VQFTDQLPESGPDFEFCFFAVYVQLRATIYSSFFFVVTTLFRPNLPSSGVQIVVIKESAAYCKAVFVSLVWLPRIADSYVG